jgi:hypothetical protein
MGVHLSRSSCCFALWAIAFANPFLLPAAAQEKTAAKCTDVHGALMTHRANGKWEGVPSGSAVPADQLLIVLFGAEFVSPNGFVQTRILADVGERGPYPVLESAVRFHPPTTADLELTIERGIVILMNKKKKGEAKVRLHVQGETFELTLHDASSRVGIEVYGRHLPGPAELKDAKKDVPVTTLALFALEGEVVISTEKQATRLQAPPGPALYLWDSVSRAFEVQRFEVLPDSVKPMSVVERKQFDGICKHAAVWFAEPGLVGAALDKAVNSPHASERKSAVVAVGAIDDLPRLMGALENKDHADTRDMAVLTMRAWLGRGPGQTVKLFDHLTKVEKYSAAQAKSLLYLLNGVEPEKRGQAQTFVVLIQSLNHSKISLRELARWHLARLVPESKSIAYDAAARAAARQEAIAQFRRLVPEGEVPSPPKKKPINP